MQRRFWKLIYLIVYTKQLIEDLNSAGKMLTWQMTNPNFIFLIIAGSGPKATTKANEQNIQPIQLYIEHPIRSHI